MSSRLRDVAFLLLALGLVLFAVVPVPGSARPEAAERPAIDPLGLVSPSRSFTTDHIRLDLDLDLKGQRIAGSVKHDMTSLRADLDEIALHAVELDIRSVTVNGEPAAFEYPVSGKQTTSWFSEDAVSRADDMLVIGLDPPLRRGEAFVVEIHYAAEPKKGLYWIAPEDGIPEKRHEVWSQGEGENNRYWIPLYDYPNDTATFEGVFRIEKGNYVLSNGTLVSEKDLGDTVQFTWRLDQPVVTYLIMIAAGEYQMYEDEVRGIPLLYVVPPGTSRETVDRGYGRTKAMMEFFIDTIGIDYPYAKYAQVVVQNFIYGGMENASSTTMNLRTLHDERSYLTRNNHGLVAHELAHQWWGDLVTCREWSHFWLNEGFATYYEALFHEQFEGDEKFRYDMDRRHRRVVSDDDLGPRPLVTDFYNRQDARNSNNVYNKGSSVLHMLRFILGDEQYHAVIRHYGTRHRYGVVETSDLMRAVKDVTGENLDWFFEQWVFLAGHPKFTVTKSWDDETGLLHLNVRQTQEAGKLVPIFRIPLDVEVTTDASVKTYRILIDEEDQDFYFDLPSEPKMVVFDKGDWIIKTLDFDKTAGELVYQLENGDTMTRVRAARSLGKKGSSPKSVPALRAALIASGHYGLRREAALALGQIETEAAREALIQGTREADARVRQASAEALGNFKHDETAADELVRLLGNDPAYGVREKAVASLVKMESEEAAAACREALAQESDRSIVRNAGINGLVTLRSVEDLNLIRGYAAPGNKRDHRHTAITAYAKLARRLEMDRDREEAAAFLADMLDDWYLRTRRTVISALGTLGEPSAVAELRRAESNDPLESLRNQARKTADRIASGTDDEEELTAVETKVKGLEKKIHELEKTLLDLKQKVPEKTRREEAAAVPE